MGETAQELDQAGKKLVDEKKLDEAAKKFAEAGDKYREDKKWLEAEIEFRKAADYAEAAAKAATKNEGDGGKSELYELAAKLHESAEQALEELATSALARKDKKTAKDYLNQVADHFKKAADDHRKAADADKEASEAAAERRAAENDDTSERLFRALAKAL